MSKRTIFQVSIQSADEMGVMLGLIRAAEDIVSNLSEVTRKELLVKLVMHAILQDSGAGGLIDAVDLLRDSGIYIGDEAKHRMREDRD